ncbi:MAG: ATP-binding protein [Opitutaceae bacterium]|nr:ATP-binding protein [Opitutaceae bacterium]
MNSLATLPQRTWLERASTAFAVTLIVLGTVTASGWLLGRNELIQPFLGLPTLKFNSALCLAFVGAVLLGFEFGHRSLGWLGLAPWLVTLLTLVQYAFHVDLAIDEAFLRDRLLVDTAYAGRMSPLFGFSIFISSSLLIWRTSRKAERARLFIEAVVGSVLAAAGFSILLGYAASLPAVYSWGAETSTSPVAAIGLLALGLAFVSLTWRETMKIDGEAPRWSPMPIIIGCMTLTTILWVGLRDRELAYVGKTTQSQIDALALTIKSELAQQVSMVELLARGRASVADTTTAGWIADARREFTQAQTVGCLSLSFVGRDGRTQWIHPLEGNESAIGFDHFGDTLAAGRRESAGARRSALEEVRNTGSPVISSTTQVLLPGTRTLERGVAIYAPVARDGEVIGYIAADYAYRRLFAALTARLKLDSVYHVSLGIGGETVFESAPPNVVLNGELTLERNPTLAKRRVRIALTPSSATIAAERRYLPEVALLAGFGITLLLGLSVHLARNARAGQRAAELSNKKLFAENDERRRVEARLKVSDERLRLALDSTQIGIFEWTIAAGHVYYSPGLWAMLEYDHSRMPSTVEAWQSLIHPDDLALYRRRTESQLQGTASFIEPEYRVRARSGDWRWVYTRAKSVAASPDGRPVRIIGTVQDITARREAEIALRESQAEARKLSLVAAKTDNPVLISSPDGRIEWANEAFCRVMEYSLDEVVGKNPAHFMIGPETNLRTVARIRAAMARGHGTSTDLVNYSKSGRKYHLHAEIQPVHGPDGQVVNFIAVGTDITTRVETEKQLRRAKAEADDASRAKSEFLASMSHEIRTPMNGVIGMTSLLMETTLSPEQRDFVNTIRTSGEALLTIINDILDFSKIESGKMELERAPFELSLCLEEVLDLFALQVSAKRLEMAYYVAPDVPSWITGDGMRLRQILVNLVNNAVKFTPSGSISLEVRRVTRERTELGFAPVFADSPRVILEFTVRDTGIGIPGDRVDRLFKAFSQVDSSTTRKYGGTGLGLAICQRLCELMGGTVRVESEPGAGSAFMFTIHTEGAAGPADMKSMPPTPAALRLGPVLCVEDHPVTQARLRGIFAQWGVDCIITPDAAAALRVAAGLPQSPSLLVIDGGELEGTSPLEVLAPVSGPRLLLYPFGQAAPLPIDANPLASVTKPIRSNAFLHAILELFESTGHGGATPLASQHRRIGDEIPLDILLAEDNAVNQKVALRFLERLGYHAKAVSNGIEAVSAMERQNFDLILMDLQMPEMDGIEATRQIRARLEPRRQPKIIALTANAMQGDRELCVAAGMDDHISKPVKMHEIDAAIRRHFGKPTETRIGRELIG